MVSAFRFPISSEKQKITNKKESRINNRDPKNVAEPILEKAKIGRKSKLSQSAVRNVTSKMKISAFILSFCGFCVLYICNADWIDDLIEDYLGSDYEEIAPFISSVTSGVEEFDQMVAELSQSKRRWWFSPSLVLLTFFSCFLLSILLPRQVFYPSKTLGIMKTIVKFLTNFKKSALDKEEIQTIVSEFLEKKFKQLCGNKQPNDVPVKLLWKGGTLVESSIHCNIKEQTKLQLVQGNLLHSNVLYGPSSCQMGKMELVPSSSETSTTRKMVEIRKMLESEQELTKFRDEGLGAADKGEGGVRKGFLSNSHKTQQSLNPGCDVSEEGEEFGRKGRLQKLCRRNTENKTDQGQKGEAESKLDSDFEPDPKLMNRIRLLESRLRLEELKNKNWINRMSRAEGILQQLNKQVERIEESRPMGTLTETLKITSTVTNWVPSSQPRRNMRFTLVNQYPLFCMQTPYASLSELIKKEVGLPTPDDCNKNLLQLSPTPQITALPSPIVLSKFLCR